MSINFLRIASSFIWLNNSLDLLSLNQLWFKASSALILFCGSLFNNLVIKSFAFLEILSKGDDSKSYLPKSILFNNSSSFSFSSSPPLKGNLWLNNIAGSYVVNGDKPLIHIGDDCTVYGTPWAGKERMNRNVGVKLCGIVILNRGAENHIEKVPMTKILPVLIQQSYRPKDRVNLEKTLSLLSRMGKKIPMYQLYCNMNPDAALTAYNVLSGAEHEWE